MYTVPAHADVNRKQIIYFVVGCLVTEENTEMAKGKARDMFDWTNNDNWTHEYKVVEKQLEVAGALSIAEGNHGDGKGVGYPQKKDPVGRWMWVSASSFSKDSVYAHPN